MNGQHDNHTIAAAPAKIPGGYFIIARKLFDGEIMSKPPLHMKLWVWMLEKAFWKDGDKLKRGQFHTSIAEMQNAMAFKIGYRKVTPTKDEIRSAYEAFTKPTMITTAKTTRGMIITICNYSYYQDFKNYEAHSESHSEDSTKPTVTPHDREGRFKEGLKKESKPSCPKPKKPVSPDALRLSDMLASMILKNNPKHTKLTNGGRKSTVTSWAHDIDQLIRIDSQAPEEVERVITWCQSDSFWKVNILSGSALRKQWDKLTVKMASEVEKAGYPKNQASGGGNTMASLREKGVDV